MKPRPFHQHIVEYRNQLQKGIVHLVYKGIIDYIKDLRMDLKKKYPDYFVSDVHIGQMDYTYFYFFPKTLKQHKLKVVIIFFHDTLKFDVWLAGYNKAAQAEYWKIIKERGFNKYQLAPSPDVGDSIIAHTLNGEPDFSKLDILTEELEAGILGFIQDIENCLNVKP